MYKKALWSIVMLFIFSINLLAQNKKVEKGIASYYHDHLCSRRTANGELYHPAKLTAAHLTLPFNTIVRVLNLRNNKSVIVRINDRGPFIENRIIDLSKAAADSLDFLEHGLTKVEIKILSFGKPKSADTESVYLASTASIPKKNVSQGKKNMKASHKLQKKKTDSTVIASEIIQRYDTSLTDTSALQEKTILYGVQIGSFKYKSNMLKLSERLKTHFIEKFNIQEIIKDNDLYYRMILGEFSTEIQAVKLKKKIEKEFPGCFIISYKN